MNDGLLLINLGTPDFPDRTSVRRYLRQFLADERVINLPAPLRYLLLYGFILPFRPKKTALAYQAIWTDEGSPLLIHSQQLCAKLQQRLGKTHKVVLAMRYGKPDISTALNELQECKKIIVLPLYPQYSSAATGSSLEEVFNQLNQKLTFPSLSVIRDFHDHPGFIAAQAELIKPYVENHDHLLLSYHGLPENHLLHGDCKTQCVISCSAKSANYASCYRAQSIHTSTLLAQTLNLNSHKYSTSFQSRLGRTPWIKPYTDKILSELANQGVKRLAIACPSFVADCLETLEEIGIRAREQWLALGGEQLTLIPCVNESDLWVEAILNLTELSSPK